MTPVNDLFRRELWAWCRQVGTAELHDRIDVLDLYWNLEEERLNCEIERNREQHDALWTELERRRLSALRVPGGPDPDGERYQQWTDLAKDIRKRIDLPWLFDHLGYLLKLEGTNSRRNAAEWSGACPLCGGTDRLRVFGGSGGVAWCRRCGWNADAISVAQSLDVTIVGFYGAVRFLAQELGLETPDKSTFSPVVKEAVLSSGAVFHPITVGKKHG